MALVRCLDRHSPPAGRRHRYVCSVQPVGYPNTALICGIPDCNNPGVIWHDQNEKEKYKKNIKTEKENSKFYKISVSITASLLLKIKRNNF